MKRRQFVQCAAASALGTGLFGARCGLGAVPLNQLDRFGGWIAKKFAATGFFRVEKEDRWWLVTPEGNAFLSFGINHLESGLFKQDYNREAWLKRLGIESTNWPEFQPALRQWFLRTCEQYGFNTAI